MIAEEAVFLERALAAMVKWQIASNDTPYFIECYSHFFHFTIRFDYG